MSIFDKERLGRIKHISSEDKTCFQQILALAQPLPDEEQKKLLESIHKSPKPCSEEALQVRNTLVKHNLRLVVPICRDYPNRGILFDDLFQEGTIGLMKAVERFDPQRGCEFSTYAYFWIRQAITSAIYNKEEMVRLPVHAQELRRRILSTQEEYLNQIGRFPAIEELAVSLGIGSNRITDILCASEEPISLEQSFDGFKKEVIRDSYPPPEEIVLQILEKETLEQLLPTLTAREERILCLHSGLNGYPPHTLQEIGSLFGGLTREAIRRIEAQAIKKLQKRVAILE